MSALRIGALIPVRLASERLPGKALKEICGKPVVCHLLDRVFASRFIADPKDAVVCTTEEAGDAPLVKIVQDYGASVFRGDTDDIIKRFRDAIETFRFDAVIQVDGDDILCDPLYMDLTMDRLLTNAPLDVVSCRGLPLGIASKSFTRRAMDKVFAHYRSSRNDTGFAYFFTRSGLCRQAVIDPVTPEHVLDEARLTLDYQVDLEVFTRIFEAVYREGEVFGLADVTRFLRDTPEVMEINANLDEEYWARTREKADLEFVDSGGVTRSIEV